MARPRGRIVRRTPSLKTWSGQEVPLFGNDSTGTSGLFSNGLVSFGTASDLDSTILRTRGEMMCNVSTAQGANDNYQYAVGLGLCTEEAAAAVAVPLPFDNPDWDGWFVYNVISLISVVDGNYTGRMTIDSKAMRKVPSGMVIFASTQIFTGSGSGGELGRQIVQLRGLLKTS